MSAIGRGLARGAVEVIEAKVTTAACGDETCLHEQASKHAADHVVRAWIRVDRRDYAITMALIDGDNGEEVARVDTRCDLCGIGEVVDHVDSQAATLLARLERSSRSPPVLAVRSQPPRALVLVDGRVVGETPLERRIEPGAHVVGARLHGHVDETRRFEAMPGVRETMVFDLVPLPRHDRRRRMWAAGFAGIGIGTVAAATGFTLLAIHGRENHARCTGGDVDAQGDCKYLFATKVPGLIVTSIGAALIVTGIALVAASRARRRAR
jgi:hypothetical protein